MPRLNLMLLFYYVRITHELQCNRCSPCFAVIISNSDSVLPSDAGPISIFLKILSVLSCKKVILTEQPSPAPDPLSLRICLA